MKKLSQKGFTMIELLVVLLIIGILAAVAAPLFLGNSDKAKASEAAATLGMLRQAEREYRAKHGTYIAPATADLANPQEPPSGTNPGLGITINPAKFFSQESYSVSVGTSTMLDGATGLDFLIVANGANSSAANARSGCEVGGATNSQCGTVGARIRVQMDNTGHTVMGVTPAGGGTEKITVY